METVTAAEFNQRPSRVKRRAALGPVVITEHNRPSYVLISYAEYERLLGTPTNLADWLEMDQDVDLEIEPLKLDLRPAEL
ncbi:MAG TPA: type II toxin-antitoxin system Phd/YefM family antitoxin [Nocardioides sp.]|jgi:prevent-host-death family protein